MSLKKIKIGSTVTSLEDGLLLNLTNLEVVDLHSVNKNLEIPKKCFIGCRNLSSIDASYTVSSKKLIIRESTFADCINLEDVKYNNILSIELSAFNNCSSLTSFDFLNSITSIGTSAFKNTRLTSVLFNDSSNVRIESYAFANNSRLTQVSLPNSCSYAGTRFLNSCSNLKSLSVGQTSLNFFSNDALAGSSINKIYLKNIRSSDIMSSGIKTKIIDTHLLGLNHNCTIYSSNGRVITYTYSTNSITILSRISFDGNESTSGTMDYIEMQSGRKWTCPECLFKKSCHVFNGYFTTRSDGSGDRYYPNTQYDVPIDNLTLYASWKLVGKTMVVICVSNLEKTAYASGELVYDLIYSIHGDKNTEYHFFNDDHDTVKDGTITTEDPTEDNIFGYLREGMTNDEYGLVIFYLFDHGSTAGFVSIRSKKGIGGNIFGTDIAEIVEAGNKETRFMFMCDCCHSGAVDPYIVTSSSVKKSESSTQSSEVADDGISITELMFQYFNLKNNQLRLSNSSLLGATSNLNTDPKILCWHNCRKSYVGWHTGESLWIKRLNSIFDETQTYELISETLNSVPYWYKLCKDGDYSPYQYYYSKTLPKGYSIAAYGYKSNYNNNFDESIQVFT